MVIYSDKIEEKSRWQWLQASKNASRTIEVSYNQDDCHMLNAVHFAYDPEVSLNLQFIADILYKHIILTMCVG